jgi:addiction module HigA family antidote
MNEQQGMENPPHPGDFIAEIYLEPFKISGRELAQQLDVAASTLSRVLNGGSRVTPEMALRLSKVLGRSAESWLAMQDAHDLWVARQTLDLARVRPLELSAAG